MSDADALLAAVLADPDADLPRLVYADWLDEHGDADRAEFIRVQIELAHDRGAVDARSIALRARQWALLDLHRVRWMAPLLGPDVPPDGLLTSLWTFRRGFVEAVGLPVRPFLRDADRLFRLTPVRELHTVGVTVPQLGELVGSAYLVRLSGLDLSDSPVGNAAVRALAAVEAAAALRVLRLRRCGLTDEWARELAAVRFAWPLRELDVSFNPLTADGLAALRERFGAAVRFDGG